MSQRGYQRIAGFFSQHPGGSKALAYGAKLLPVVMAGIYVAMLGVLAWHRDARLWTAVLAPALSFGMGTWLRKWLNWPRPYEHMDLQPVSKKKEPGLSFPSRHSVSAFAIALACLSVWPPLGYGMLLGAVLVAVTRVLTLVHHVRDVVAGAALSWLVHMLFCII